MWAAKGVANTIGMNLGGTVNLDGVAVTQVEAKHSAGVMDEDGTHYAGVASGYVLAVGDGPVLYHSGDTTVFGDMKLIGELYRPQVAMLPIGGHFTMGPRGGGHGGPASGSKDNFAAAFRDHSAAKGHA